MSRSTRWMVVSKPLRPPLDDGTTRLCDTWIRALPSEHELAYFGDPANPLRSAGDEVIERAPMGHAPGIAAKAEVLREMVSRRHRHLPLHVFFTPNRVTSRVLAWVRRLTPRRPVLQTVTSSHEVERFAALLRPLSAVVVLSDDARRRLIGAGLPADRIHRVHPVVPSVDPETGPIATRMIYAGDLDDAVAGRLIAIARALARPELAGWTLVIACRPKGDGDGPARARLRRTLSDEIAEGRIELHGRVPDFDRLLRSCGLQLFAADHARCKVDLPITVLEGLARGLGVVMIDVAPINEILDRAAEADLEVGMRAAPEDLVERTVDACVDLERLARWRRDGPRLVERAFTPQTMALAYARLHAELAELAELAR